MMNLTLLVLATAPAFGLYMQKGDRDPKWDDIVRQAFVLYEKDNDFPKSAELFDRIVELGCRDPIVMYRRGLCYENTALPGAAAAERALRDLNAARRGLAERYPGHYYNGYIGERVKVLSQKVLGLRAFYERVNELEKRARGGDDLDAWLALGRECLSGWVRNSPGDCIQRDPECIDERVRKLGIEALSRAVELSKGDAFVKHLAWLACHQAGEEEKAEAFAGWNADWEVAISDDFSDPASGLSRRWYVDNAYVFDVPRNSYAHGCYPFLFGDFDAQVTVKVIEVRPGRWGPDYAILAPLDHRFSAGRHYVTFGPDAQRIQICYDFHLGYLYDGQKMRIRVRRANASMQPTRVRVVRFRDQLSFFYGGVLLNAIRLELPKGRFGMRCEGMKAAFDDLVICCPKGQFAPVSLSEARLRLTEHQINGYVADIDRGRPPKYPYAEIGSLYMSVGVLDAAEAALKKSLGVDPDYAYALGLYGKLCVKTGRYAEALEYLERAKALGRRIEHDIVGFHQLMEEAKRGVEAEAVPEEAPEEAF